MNLFRIFWWIITFKTFQVVHDVPMNRSHTFKNALQSLMMFVKGKDVIHRLLGQCLHFYNQCLDNVFTSTINIMQKCKYVPEFSIRRPCRRLLVHFVPRKFFLCISMAYTRFFTHYQSIMNQNVSMPLN